METMEQILIGCLFSRITWHEVLSWVRSTARIPTSGDRFVDWWQSTVHSAPTAAGKGSSLLILLTAWLIWKQRNMASFNGAQPDNARLLDTIKAEAQLSATAGAAGLVALLLAETSF
jgi:hypothetical protein